jgi:hypothetical protein
MTVAARAVAALAMRQRRIAVESLVVASVGVETVPTAVRGIPLVLTVVSEVGVCVVQQDRWRADR